MSSKSGCKYGQTLTIGRKSRNHITANNAVNLHIRLANAYFADMMAKWSAFAPFGTKMPKQDQKPGMPPKEGLRFTRILAGLAIVWERLWVLALPVICVLALFASVSWLGLWPLFNDYVRYAVLAVFAGGFLYTVPRLFKFRAPTNAEIDTRIERSSELAHRPVTAQADAASDVTKPDDPFALALWHEHKRRMAASLTGVRAGTPNPKVAAADPYALRAIVGLFLFIGLMAGWGNYGTRIADAFRPHDTLAQLEGRVDAWVKPPAYTNKPPIFLRKFARKSPEDQANTITVPEGSQLVIRVLDIENASVDLTQNDLTRTIEADQTPSQKASASNDTGSKPRSQVFTTKLGSSGSAVLKSGEGELFSWTFNILPDASPTIAFVEDPKPSSRGALEFSYKVQDDFGIASAKADIITKGQAGGGAEPLIDAPKIDLPLPRRNAKSGTAKTSQDLTSHPWAGAKVSLMLIVKDQAEQTGRSATKNITLPERVFTKPLAKAVVFERRRLALDARTQRSVAEMLDIITTTHPDTFIKNLSTYTALRVATRSIKRARDEDTLRGSLELLWEIALAIEDGDLSLAERRLRDAQERLAKALENGASNEEIAKLMQELRQAMNEFMQQLAEQMQRNQQNQQAMPMDPNAQVLRQQDIERMMKQIEDLAKSGSRDAARQLLEEMQRMMNNLQTARPQQQQRQSDQFSEQMNKLGDMMRQQQQLMDETFKMKRRQQQRQQQQQNGQQQNQQNQKNQQGNNGQQNGDQKPMTPEEFAEAMKELQKRQGELSQQMKELQKGLDELGMEPGEKLGEAGEAMNQAEGDLGQSKPGEAGGQQGRALQAMREGAQQLMRNMQNQAGEQGRQGERGQHGQQSRRDQDPLGRQSRSQGPQLGNDTKVPGEIDAQRAREILDAIRKKLGESSRPKLELDYLDRLLPTR